MSCGGFSTWGMKETRLKHDSRTMRKDYDSGVDWSAIGVVAAFVLACLLAGLLTSCSRKVYLPVYHTEVRTDTLREMKVRVDSVWLRDSVTVERRGDTVYMSRWRERVRVAERVDTVYMSRTDTVREPSKLPAEVEALLGGKGGRGAGAGFVWAAGGAVVALLVALVILVRKKF